MPKRPRTLVTVDEAAELLGLSHREVIVLIANNELRWTVTPGKKTVVVDVDSAPRRPKGSSPAKPLGAPAARVSRDRETISELDAWSQPKSNGRA